MSADIFRTNQFIIIMLNQKHSYLTFNKRGKQEMSLEFEPLLPCKEIKPQIVDETVCGFISYIEVHHQCPIKIGTFQKLNKSVPIDRP